MGGVIVLLGQRIEREAKAKRELNALIHETYAQSEMLLLFIKNLLTELASHKSESEYWWSCFLHEANGRNDGEEKSEDEKLYYLNNSTVTEQGHKCRLKLGEVLADYYGKMSKLNIITKKNVDLSFVPLLITNTAFPEAKKIEIKTIGDELDSDGMLADYNTKRIELISRYLDLFKELDKLSGSFKSVCITTDEE